MTFVFITVARLALTWCRAKLLEPGPLHRQMRTVSIEEEMRERGPRGRRDGGWGGVGGGPEGWPSRCVVCRKTISS